MGIITLVVGMRSRLGNRTSVRYSRFPHGEDKLKSSVPSNPLDIHLTEVNMKRLEESFAT